MKRSRTSKLLVQPPRHRVYGTTFRFEFDVPAGKEVESRPSFVHVVKAGMPKNWLPIAAAEILSRFKGDYVVVAPLPKVFLTALLFGTQNQIPAPYLGGHSFELLASGLFSLYGPSCAADALLVKVANRSRKKQHIILDLHGWALLKKV